MFATVPADAPGPRRAASRSPPTYLAACLRVLGTGAMEPMWDRLARARDAGRARDRHATTRSSTAIARRMLERIAPTPSTSRLDGGHALPLEHPPRSAASSSAFARRARHARRSTARPRAARRARAGSATVADQRGDQRRRVVTRVRTSRTGRDRERRGDAARAAPAAASTPQTTTATSAPTMHADVQSRGPRPRRRAPRACACRRRGRCRRRARCWRAGSRTPAGRPRARRNHAVGRHGLVLHVRAADASRRTRRTRAPSPRRARCSRTASGRRCRSRPRRSRAAPTSSSHGFTTSDSTRADDRGDAERDRAPRCAPRPVTRGRSRRAAPGPRRFASVPRTPSE